MMRMRSTWLLLPTLFLCLHCSDGISPTETSPEAGQREARADIGFEPQMERMALERSSPPENPALPDKPSPVDEPTTEPPLPPDEGTSQDTPVADMGFQEGTPGERDGADTPGIQGGLLYKESPWGMASSHAGSWDFNVKIWAPFIQKAGVTWVRGFDRNYQSNGDKALKLLEAHGQKVAGILQSGSTFPTDLDAWRTYVKTMVTRYKGRVNHWEVWNEPPNFSTSKSPTEYGRLVREAYKVAKAVDPKVKIGLAAKSVHINFLDQAFVKVPDLKGHFDYVTFHPYEVMSLVKQGWEQSYMSIRRTVRRLLATRSPQQVDVPIWLTEIGTRTRFGCGSDIRGVTEAGQVTHLIQSYTMGLAQGLTRIHWFEAKDGDGQSGCVQLDDNDKALTPSCKLIPFGLLNGCTSKPRPSYTALKTLIAALGQTPHYLGWVLLKNKHYGFVFNSSKGPVLVTWGQPGSKDPIDFGQRVELTDPVTGNTKLASKHTLTPIPIIATGIPSSLVKQAQAQFQSPFPWKGDYTQATEVSFVAPSNEKGLHPTSPSVVKTFGTDKARDASGSPAQAFGVDRNFLLYDTQKIRITVVVRRNDPTVKAGFNVKYESINGTKSANKGWVGVPSADKWHTFSWEVSDIQFVGMWGYNIRLDSDSRQHAKYSLKSITITKLP